MSTGTSNPPTRDVVLTVAWCAERSGQHRLATLLYAVGGMMVGGFKDAITPTEPDTNFHKVVEEYAVVGRRIARESIGGH